MKASLSPRPAAAWSPDLFKAFWARPSDPWRALEIVTPDIVGHWPRPIGAVRGANDYVRVIAALLEACPDFSLELAETAANGEFVFLRWIATGSGPEGPFRFNGCDRVRMRGGHVCENYVFSDDLFFARVAETLPRVTAPQQG